MPKRRQAIIWANVGMFYWRIYASLGLNELINRVCRLIWIVIKWLNHFITLKFPFQYSNWSHRSMLWNFMHMYFANLGCPLNLIKYLCQLLMRSDDVYQVNERLRRDRFLLFTHRGRHKLVTICRRHFQIYFLLRKVLHFDWNFTEISSHGSY